MRVACLCPPLPPLPRSNFHRQVQNTLLFALKTPVPPSPQGRDCVMERDDGTTPICQRDPWPAWLPPGTRWPGRVARALLETCPTVPAHASPCLELAVDGDSLAGTVPSPSNHHSKPMGQRLSLSSF